MHKGIRAVLYVVSAPFLFGLYALIYGLEDLHGLFGAVRRFYLTEEGKIDFELVGWTVFMLAFSFLFWGVVFRWAGRI
jgi:hypothetical protein